MERNTTLISIRMTLELVNKEKHDTPKLDRNITSDDLDFSDPYFYDLFVQLRKIDPFMKVKDVGWLATGYDEVQAVLKDKRFLAVSPLTTIINQVFQNMDAVTSFLISRPLKYFMKKDEFVHMTKEWLIFTNPPHHTHIRKLFNQAFTPKQIKLMEPKIRKVTKELVDELKTKKEFDFIKEFAFPLPIIIITEILGIPEEKKLLFKQWSEDMLNGFLFESLRDLPKVRKAGKSRKQAIAYLNEIIVEKEINPGDDLISVLLLERKNGLDLDTEQIVANIIFLLFAGHETTVNLLTNGLYALLTHLDAKEKLIEIPDMLDQAVEEMLRFDPSLGMLIRIAGEDFEFKGRQITEGDVVNICLYSANHDDRMFEDPDTYILERENSRKHLAFGQGIHFCLGAPLARAETVISFEFLLPFLKSFELSSKNTFARKPMYGFSAFEELWITRVSL